MGGAAILLFEARALAPVSIVVGYAVNDLGPGVNARGLPMPGREALPGIALASPPLP